MSVQSKKKNKRKLLVLGLMTMVWSGVITGIVLRDYHKGPNYSYYEYTNDGDLIIKVFLKKDDNTPKQVVAVFVDEKGIEHRVVSNVDEKGIVRIDTSILEPNNKYVLDRIVDIDDYNNVIVSNDHLNDRQKIEIKKPIDSSYTYTKDNKKLINIKTNPELINNILEVKYQDQNGNEYTITGVVDEHSNVSFDTSLLPPGNVYKLVEVSKANSNPKVKVVNVDNIDQSFKTLDKTRDYAPSGDVVVNVQLPPNSPKDVVGIFVDENNNVYRVPGTINDDGYVSFDTTLLPKNHIYNLDKVVDANDVNNVVIPNENLTSQHKEPIPKPRDVIVSFVDDNLNDNNVKTKLDTNLKNTEVTATFKDEDGNEYPITSTVDENGNVVFDTSSLPKDKLYVLDRITKANTEPEIKVANIDDVKRTLKTINKLNTDNVNNPYQYNEDGDIQLKVKTDKQTYAGDQVVGIFEDQNGNVHKIVADVDENGDVVFDLGKLPNNNVYNLKEVVSFTDPQRTVVSNKELSPNQKADLHKPNASVTKHENKDYELNIKDPNFKNQDVTAVFVDEKNQEFRVVGRVDDNGNVIFDTKNDNNLPTGHTYTLKQVLAPNGDNIVNTNDLSNNDKTLDKFNTQKLQDDGIIDYDDKGNQVININKDPNNQTTLDPSKEYVAIFTDKDGNKHKVDATYNPVTKEVEINTDKLPNNNQYNLDKVVEKENNDVVVIANDKLSDEEKVTITKPSATIVLDDNNNVNLHTTDKNLIGKDIKLEIVDEDGNKYIVDATAPVDEYGNTTFNTGDSSILPPNHKYKITGVLDENNNKVINLDDVPTKDKEISKIDTGNVDENNNLILDVDNTHVGKDVIVEFKDQDGNVVEVPTTVNDDSKVVVDLNNPLLDPNKIYEISKVVDKDSTSIPKDVILDNSDLNDNVKLINNSTDAARKIILGEPTKVDVSPTASTIIIPVKDVNHLAINKPLIIAFADKNNPDNKVYRIVKIDENTSKIEVPLLNLDEDVTYVYDNIKFEDESLNTSTNDSALDKTRKIAIDDSSLTGFEFTTNKQDNPQVSDVVVNSTTPNTISATVVVNDHKDKPQTIAVTYSELDENNNPINTKTIEIQQDANGSFNVDLANLKPNTKYEITSIKDPQTNKELNRTHNTDRQIIIGTQPTPNNVSFNVDAPNNKYESTAVAINVEFDDLDDKIKLGNPVTLTLKNKDTNEVFEVVGYVNKEADPIIGSKGNILFEIDGLTEDTNYELVSLKANNKSDTAYTNPLFNDFVDNNTFKTPLPFSKITNINSQRSIYTANTTRIEIEVSLKFGDDKQTYNNKYLQLVYQTPGGEEIKSTPVLFNLPNELTKTITFVFDNLDSDDANNFKFNHHYIFAKVVVADSIVDLTTSNKTILSDTTHEFRTRPLSAIAINDIANVQPISPRDNNTQVTYKIPVNDEDKVLSEVDSNLLKVAVANLDGTNPRLVENPKIVIDADGNRFVEFTVDNVDLNTKYQVQKIEFTSKPNNASYNINPVDDSNTLFDVNNHKNDANQPLVFENVLNVASIVLTKPNDNTPLESTLDENNKHVIESYDENNVSINVDLNKDDGLLNNKYLRVVFKDNNDQLVVSNPILVDNTTKKFSFSLPQTNDQLTTNRKYDFVGIYHFDDQNPPTSLANLDDNNKLVNDIVVPSIIKEPTTTNIASQSVTNITSRKATIEVELQNSDDVFEENQVVELTFVDSDQQEPKTPVVLSAKVIKKDDGKWYATGTFGDPLTNDNNQPIPNTNQLLNSNTTYQLQSAKFIDKPKKAYKNVNNDANNIFFNERDAVQVVFTTAVPTVEINSIIAHDVRKADQTTNDVVVKITNNGTTLFDKKLQVVYHDGTKEVKSNILDGFDYNENDPTSYSFVLNNLEGNKRYLFVKLIYANSEAELQSSPQTYPNPNRINNSFVTRAGNPIKIDTNTKVVEEDKLSPTKTTILIEVDDKDNVFKPNDSFKVTLANTNNGVENVVDENKVTAKFVEKNNKKYVEVTIDPSELNNPYKVKEIEFIPPADNPPPFKVSADETSNIIYKDTDTNAADLSFENNMKVTTVSVNGPSDENPTTITTNLTLNKDEGWINDKFIRVKYVDNNNEEKWSQPIAVGSNADENQTFSIPTNNLTPNRSYTFGGVYYFDNANDVSDTNQPTLITTTADTTNTSFVTKPSTTFVTDINITKIDDDRAFFDFNVDSNDDVFENNQVVEVVLKKQGQQDDQQPTIAEVLLSKVGEQWQVQPQITTNLDPNTTYVIDQIRFKDKPQRANTALNADNNVIYKKPDQNPITFTTKQATTVESLSSPAQHIPTSAQANTTFSVDSLILKHSDRLSSKFIKLVYSSSNGPDLISSANQLDASEVPNNNQYTFTNIPHNREYTFKKAVFGDDANFVVNDDTPTIAIKEGLSHSFVIEAQKVTLTLDTNDTNKLSTFWDEPSQQFKATIKLPYTDPDNQLQNNQQVNFKYKPTNTNVYLDATGVVNTVDSTINLVLSNLEPSTNYEFGEISTTTKKDGEKNPVLFNEVSTEFRTVDARFFVVSLNSQQEVSSTTNTVNVTIKKQGPRINGLYARLVYSNSAGDDIYSDLKEIQQNVDSYAFVFDNLQKNRQYTFKKLVYGSQSDINERSRVAANSDSIKEFEKINDFDTNTNNIKSFRTTPSDISLSNYQTITRTITNNTNSSLTVRYSISDVDGILTKDVDALVVELQNNNQTKIIGNTNTNSIFVKEDATNNSKYIEFSVDNINTNEQWTLAKVYFKQKPQKATFDYIGSNANQTNSADKLKLDITNVSATKLFNDLRISSANPAPSVVADQNKATITAGLTISPNLLNNKKLKAKWVAQSDASDVKWSNELTSNSLVIDANNNTSISFEVLNLNKNRNYIFSGLYYYDDGADLNTLNNNSTITKDSNVILDFVTPNGNTKVLNFNTRAVSSATADIEITIETQDNIFANDQVYEVEFSDNANPSTSVTATAALKNVTDVEANRQTGTLRFEFSGLNDDREYTLKTLKFKPTANQTKPAKANVNVNNNADNLVYSATAVDGVPAYSGSNKFVTNLSQYRFDRISTPNNAAVVELENNNTTKVTAVLVTDGTKLRGKGLQLFYRYIDDNAVSQEVKSNVVAFATDAEGTEKELSFEFTFNNLQKNRNYVFSKIAYTDSPTSENNPFDFIDPTSTYTHNFNTQRSAAISISNTLVESPRTSIDAVGLLFDITDPDNVLIGDEDLNITFAKLDGTSPTTIPAKVKVIRDATNNTTKKVVEFSATPIELNQEYKISQVEFANKPPRAGVNVGTNATDNIIYTDNNQQNLLKFKNELQATSITPTQPAKDATSASVAVNLNRSNNLIQNKYLRLKYIDNNNNVVWSQPLQLTGDANSTNPLNFVVGSENNKLIANRQYSLDGLYYFDDQNDTTNPKPTKELTQELKTSGQITTPPSDSYVTKPAEGTNNSTAFVNADENKATIRLNFNSKDEAFDDSSINSVQATITIAKQDPNNTSSITGQTGTTKTFKATLKKDGDQWYFEGTTTNDLDSNTKYVVTQVTVDGDSSASNKPSSKVHTFFNSENNNKIYPINTHQEQILFSTLEETKVKSVVSTDSIDNRTATIDVVLERFGTRLDNKWMRVVYKDENNIEYVSHQLRVETNKTHTYHFAYEPNTNSDHSQPNGLLGNRTYTFDRLVYGNDENFDYKTATSLKVDDTITNNKDTFVTNPTPINISVVSQIISDNEFDATTNKYKAKVTYSFDDVDQSLKQNDSVVATFGEVGANGTVTNLSQTVNLTVNTNKQLSGEIPAILDFGKNYKLVSLSKTKNTTVPNKETKDPVFADLSNLAVFTTPLEEYKVLSITSTKTEYSSNETPSVTIKIKRRGTKLNNKHLKLVYRDQNNEIHTSLAVLFATDHNDNKDYTFSINNWPYNRGFEFVKLVYGDNDSFTDLSNEVDKNDANLTNSFSLLPRGISATYSSTSNNQVTNNDVSSLKVKFTIQDQDNVLVKGSDKVNIVISKVDGSSMMSISDVTIKEENQQGGTTTKFVEFDVNNIPINTQYKVNKITLVDKPDKAKYDFISANDRTSANKYDIYTNANNQDLFENKITIQSITNTPNSPITVGTGTNQNNSFNTTITFENKPTNLLDNKYVKLTYVALGKDGVEIPNSTVTTNAVMVTNNSVTIPSANLTPNRGYKIKAINYGDSQNFNEATNNQLGPQDKLTNNPVIVTNQGTTKVLNPTTNSPSPTPTSTSLRVEVQSDDNVLENNQQLTAVIKKKNGTDSDTVSVVGTLQQDASGVYSVVFDFNNLDSNTDYELQTINFNEQPTKAYAKLNNKDNNVIYNVNEVTDDNEKISFKTLETITSLDEINSADITNPTTNPMINVVAVVTNIGTELKNKKLQAIYTSADGLQIKSTPIVVDKFDGQKQYTFEFNKTNNPNTLKANRVYTFSKIVYGDDNELVTINDQSKTINNVNNITDQFSITYNQTTVGELSTIERTPEQISMIPIKLVVNDVDDVLKAANENAATIVVAKVNDLNNPITIQPQNVKITIDANNNNTKYLEFAIPNVELNQEYKIISITTNKPDHAYKNLNDNGVIYDDATATTKLPHTSNSLNVSHLLEFAKDTTKQSNAAKLKVTINVTPRLLENKKLRAKIRAVSENSREFFSDENFTIEDSNNGAEFKNYTFSFDNLTANRQYELVDVYYGDSHNDANNVITKNITINTTVDIEPSITSITNYSSSDITYRSAKLKFTLSNNDDFAYNEGHLFEVVLKHKDNSGAEVRFDAALKKEMNNNSEIWFLEEDTLQKGLTLTSDKDFKVLSITSKSKPTQTWKNLNSNGVIYSYDSATTKHEFKTLAPEFNLDEVTSTATEINADLSNLSISTKIKIEGHELDNKYVKLIYKDQDNNYYSSKAIQLPTNNDDAQRTFTFAHEQNSPLFNSPALKKNQTYSLVGVFYGDDANFANNVNDQNIGSLKKLTDKTNNGAQAQTPHTFNVLRTQPITVSLNETQNRSNINNAAITLVFDDVDNTLAQNAQVKVKFKNRDETTHSINVNNNTKSVSLNVDNLTINQDLEVEYVKVQPSRSVYQGVGVSTNKANDNVYSVYENQNTLKINNQLSVSAPTITPSADITPKSIVYSLTGNDKIINGLYFKAFYSTNNASENKYETNSATAVNSNQVTLQLPQNGSLAANRLYTNFKFVYENQQSNLTQNSPALSLTHSFEVLPSQTTISKAQHFSVDAQNTTTSVQLTFDLNSQDQLFESTDQATITIIPTNATLAANSTNTKTKTVNLANITNNKNQANLVNVLFDGLIPNTQYKVQSITLSNKPQNASLKGNKDVNLVIVDQDQMTFATKPSTIDWNLNLNNSNISFNSIDLKIDINQDSDNSLQNNDVVKLLYLPKNDQNSQPLEADLSVEVANNGSKKLVGTITNLEPNTPYTIIGFDPQNKKPEHHSKYEFATKTSNNEFSTRQINFAINSIDILNNQNQAISSPLQNPQDLKIKVTISQESNLLDNKVFKLVYQSAKTNEMITKTLNASSTNNTYEFSVSANELKNNRFYKYIGLYYGDNVNNANTLFGNSDSKKNYVNANTDSLEQTHEFGILPTPITNANVRIVDIQSSILDDPNTSGTTEAYRTKFKIAFIDSDNVVSDNEDLEITISNKNYKTAQAPNNLTSANALKTKRTSTSSNEIKTLDFLVDGQKEYPINSVRELTNLAFTNKPQKAYYNLNNATNKTNGDNVLINNNSKIAFYPRRLEATAISVSTNNQLINPQTTNSFTSNITLERTPGYLNNKYVQLIFESQNPGEDLVSQPLQITNDNANLVFNFNNLNFKNNRKYTIKSLKWGDNASSINNDIIKPTSGLPELRTVVGDTKIKFASGNTTTSNRTLDVRLALDDPDGAFKVGDVINLEFDTDPKTSTISKDYTLTNSDLSTTNNNRVWTFNINLADLEGNTKYKLYSAKLKTPDVNTFKNQRIDNKTNDTNKLSTFINNTSTNYNTSNNNPINVDQNANTLTINANEITWNVDPSTTSTFNTATLKLKLNNVNKQIRTNQVVRVGYKVAGTNNSPTIVNGSIDANGIVTANITNLPHSTSYEVVSVNVDNKQGAPFNLNINQNPEPTNQKTFATVTAKQHINHIRLVNQSASNQYSLVTGTERHGTHRVAPNAHGIGEGAYDSPRDVFIMVQLHQDQGLLQHKKLQLVYRSEKTNEEVKSDIITIDNNVVDKTYTFRFAQSNFTYNRYYKFVALKYGDTDNTITNILSGENNRSFVVAENDDSANYEFGFIPSNSANYTISNIQTTGNIGGSDNSYAENDRITTYIEFKDHDGVISETDTLSITYFGDNLNTFNPGNNHTYNQDVFKPKYLRDDTDGKKIYTTKVVIYTKQRINDINIENDNNKRINSFGFLVKPAKAKYHLNFGIHNSNHKQEDPNNANANQISSGINASYKKVSINSTVFKANNQSINGSTTINPLTTRDFDLEITPSTSTSNNMFKGRYLRAVIKEGQTNTLIHSNSMLYNDSNIHSFTLNFRNVQLKGLTRYEFVRLEWSNDNTNWNQNPAIPYEQTNRTHDGFTTIPTRIDISSFALTNSSIKSKANTVTQNNQTRTDYQTLADSTVKFTLQDPSQVIKNGAKVKIKYGKINVKDTVKPAGDSVPEDYPLAKEIESTVVVNNNTSSITANLSDLELNNEYRIFSIIVTENNGQQIDYRNSQYQYAKLYLDENNNDQNNTYKVNNIIRVGKDASIVNPSKIANSSNTNTANASINGFKVVANNGLLNNKYIKFKYVSNTGEVVWSNEKHLNNTNSDHTTVGNQSEVERGGYNLSISTTPNKLYSLVGVFVADNANGFDDNNHLDLPLDLTRVVRQGNITTTQNVSLNIISPPSDTYVIKDPANNGNFFVDINETSAKLKFKIKSHDEALDNSTTTTTTTANVTSSTPATTKAAQIVLVTLGVSESRYNIPDQVYSVEVKHPTSNKYESDVATVELNNLTPGVKYVVKEIRFEAKPTKVNANINSTSTNDNANNVIYSNTINYQLAGGEMFFNTTINERIVSLNNQVGSEVVENTTTRWNQNQINVFAEIVKSADKIGKWFRVVYESNAEGSNNTKEVINSDAVQITASNNFIFTIKKEGNTPAWSGNREMTFKRIEIADSQNGNWTVFKNKEDNPQLPQATTDKPQSFYIQPVPITFAFTPRRLQYIQDNVNLFIDINDPDDIYPVGAVMEIALTLNNPGGNQVRSNPRYYKKIELENGKKVIKLNLINDIPNDSNKPSTRQQINDIINESNANKQTVNGSISDIAYHIFWDDYFSIPKGTPNAKSRYGKLLYENSNNENNSELREKAKAIKGTNEMFPSGNTFLLVPNENPPILTNTTHSIGNNNNYQTATISHSLSGNLGYMQNKYLRSVYTKNFSGLASDYIYSEPVQITNANLSSVNLTLNNLEQNANYRHVGLFVFNDQNTKNVSQAFEQIAFNTTSRDVFETNLKIWVQRTHHKELGVAYRSTYELKADNPLQNTLNNSDQVVVTYYESTNTNAKIRSGNINIRNDNGKWLFDFNPNNLKLNKTYIIDNIAFVRKPTNVKLFVNNDNTNKVYPANNVNTLQWVSTQPDFVLAQNSYTSYIYGFGERPQDGNAITDIGAAGYYVKPYPPAVSKFSIETKNKDDIFDTSKSYKIVLSTWQNPDNLKEYEYHTMTSFEAAVNDDDWRVYTTTKENIKHDINKDKIEIVLRTAFNNRIDIPEIFLYPGQNYHVISVEELNGRGVMNETPYLNFIQTPTPWHLNSYGTHQGINQDSPNKQLALTIKGLYTGFNGSRYTIFHKFSYRPDYGIFSRVKFITNQDNPQNVGKLISTHGEGYIDEYKYDPSILGLFRFVSNGTFNTSDATLAFDIITHDKLRENTGLDKVWYTLFMNEEFRRLANENAINNSIIQNISYKEYRDENGYVLSDEPSYSIFLPTTSNDQNSDSGRRNRYRNQTVISNNNDRMEQRYELSESDSRRSLSRRLWFKRR